MNSLPTLKQIFDNPDVAAAIIFCVAATLGQLFHALKKWGAGEVSSPVSWFTSGLQRTVGAVIGNLGGMAVFIGTGVLGPMLSLPNGWWAICLFGFMNGFSTDSALNKSTRAEWTAEQREAKNQDQP